MTVIALVASVPRFNDLLRISIPSIAKQQKLPQAIVIVTDRQRLTPHEQSLIQKVSPKTECYFIENTRIGGAAGSWNTGIDFISKYFGECYIAILDDDDIWLSNHLFACDNLVKLNKADLVLSGIGVIKNQVSVGENVPYNIEVSDFLVGNPGWQGSNTFIRLSTLKKAGGFTDGLVSSNDKDLAIRVLGINGLSIAYTKIVTVYWQCGHNPQALSAKGSVQKLKGSAQFLYLHGNKMQAEQKVAYYQRMELFFQLKEKDIKIELEKIKTYGYK
jgi:hypothetical protein